MRAILKFLINREKFRIWLVEFHFFHRPIFPISRKKVMDNISMTKPFTDNAFVNLCLYSNKFKFCYPFEEFLALQKCRTDTKPNTTTLNQTIYVSSPSWANRPNDGLVKNLTGTIRIVYSFPDHFQLPSGI